MQKNNEVFLNVKNTEASGRDWALVSAGSAGGVGVGKFSVYDRTAGQSRMVVDANGNVGIGTTSPTFDYFSGGLALANPSNVVP